MEIASASTVPAPPRRSKATRATPDAADPGLTRATQAISVAFIRAAVVLLVLSFSILAMLPLLSEGPSRIRSAAELETVQTMQRDDAASARATGASRANKRPGNRESLRVAASRASLSRAGASGRVASDDGEFGFDDSSRGDLATGDDAPLASVKASTLALDSLHASSINSTPLTPSYSASAAPSPSDLEHPGPNVSDSPEPADPGPTSDSDADSLDQAMPVSGAAWAVLWRARKGPVDPQYHSLIRGIISTVAVSALCPAPLFSRHTFVPLLSTFVQEKQEWDKGWMLLLQAIMRRRIKDWFSDAGLHGGMYVPDAPTLLERLRVARTKQNCHRYAWSGEPCSVLLCMSKCLLRIVQGRRNNRGCSDGASASGNT